MVGRKKYLKGLAFVPAIVLVKTVIDERFPNPPPQFDFGVVNRAFQAREVLLRIVLLGINVHAQLRVCVKCNFEKYHQMISTGRHDVDRRNPAAAAVHAPALVALVNELFDVVHDG